MNEIILKKTKNRKHLLEINTKQCELILKRIYLRKENILYLRIHYFKRLVKKF